MPGTERVIGASDVDPLLVLDDRFRAALAKVVDADGTPVDPVLRPANPSFGDVQANFAMGLAKRLGRPPRDIAADVVDRLDVADVCDQVEIAGPGFVNLTVRSDWLAERAVDMLGDPRLGIPRPPVDRVVIDYSAPNIAKEMHVGHLRTTIIGDALVRVLRALGHEVVPQNHIGDWGTPFGMLIEHLLDIGQARAAAELSVGNLGAFYREARAKFDADPDFAERSRRRVVELQAGDAETLDLWRLLVYESQRYFRAVYDRLGVLLTSDDTMGESAYNPVLDDVIAELDRAGLTEVSDGALCVFPPGFTGRDGDPLPLIVRKSDGGYGYATTDLAAARHRTRDLEASRLLYVVGAEQRLHLAMVFAAARMAGWLAGDARAEHVAFGTVLGADGARLRTRSGTSVKLIELLDEAVARAVRSLADRDDLTDGEREVVARQVGIGAVKYADLSVDRERDYVFRWETMFAAEGNTGPYLQYAVVRIASVIDRAGAAPEDIATHPIAITEAAERALVLHVLQYGEHVRTVGETLQPHRLCAYLYELARRFTTFYEQCPILRADDDVRASRLALSLLAARTLTSGLGLLGIEVPRRM